MNRQRLILFILVILFGIAVLWSYSAVPRPKTISTLTFKSGQQAKAVVIAADKQAHDRDDGTKLKIDLLDKEPVLFNGYRRNIFKPVFADLTKVVKQQTAAFKRPPGKQPSIVKPLIVQPVSPPLAQFTFLGFLKKGAVKTIFLAKENDILLVKKGDKFAGRYEATDISDQALTLTVSDTGAKIVIPLIENLPLATAR
ncbi:MAG: type II secretion system protein PulP [Desulfuromonadaceae bacterium]|nr:type II secretion system protein PulP [Desulfuromonadaceae bacterium]